MRYILLPGKLWIKPDPEYLYGLISDYYLVVCDIYGRCKVLACVSPASRKVNQLIFVRGELCPVSLCLCLTSLVSCGKPATVIRCACALSDQVDIIYKPKPHYIVLDLLEFFE